MQYLQVKNLHKSYTDQPLLDGVDFAIQKGQKAALVAKNGWGKSTLIKILEGKVEPNDGTVLFNKDIKVRFLSQSFDAPGTMTVWDALLTYDNPIGQLIRRYETLLAEPETDQIIIHQTLEAIEKTHAWEYEVQVKTIAGQLQLTPYFEKTMESLSGGEAKRVALAKALLDEPHFLILDEPTNHLDLDMIERLENYLKKSDMTLLMVTHDRYFLERVCTDIFELDRGKLYSYKGNYEQFLIKKAERAVQESQAVHHLKMLYQEELYRIRKAPRARGKKSVGRSKSFYALEAEYKSKKSTLAQQVKPMALEMEERRLGSKVLKIHWLSKKYGDKLILDRFKHDFKQGERVGIIGKNGVGKSTFVNLLTGNEQADSGSMEIGPTVKIWYYEQHYAIPDNEMRIIDFVKKVAEHAVIGKVKFSASQLLERFLFPLKQQQAKLFSLSGGERRRLRLLMILIQNPNFLILDEPTNDLDLMSLWVLEEFLLAYTGCLIIISHDRFFMDKLVDHLFVFQWNGVVDDFWGTYSEYKQSLWAIGEEARRGKKDAEEKSSQTLLNSETSSDPFLKESQWPKKLSYHEKREFEQLGADIQKLEQRKEEINLIFQQETIDTGLIKELGKELNALVLNLDTKERRRLELAERE